MDGVQALIFKAELRPATSWSNGQLILRKISKIFTVPPDLLALFKGPTSKGREGEEEREKEGKRRGGKGRGREGRVGPNWGVWIRQWHKCSATADSLRIHTSL